MEMYLIKSAACLSVLLLFYKLLLEKENMHVFKRFYLLISVMAAIVIPFITFTTYVEPASENLNAFIYSSEVSPEVIAKNTNFWPYIFFGIYLLGVLFFSIKFFRNLRSLILKIRTNPKLRSNSFINVLLSEKIQPHTFFSYIFFNREKYLQDEIPQDVKIHEEAHARQKHSLDVLFVELLQIIFWFNPLIFLLKDAVKLNHEFLADREVIKKGISTSIYQQTLLAYSSGDLQCDLVNSINYSSTRLTVFGKTFSFGKFGQVKKRFTVMKTKTSKRTIWARSLLLLPVLAVLLYGFSTKEVVEGNNKDNSPIILQINETLELVVDKEGSIFIGNNKISLSKLRNIENGKYTEASINASTKSPQRVIDELMEVIRSKGIRKISICSPGDRSFINSEQTIQEKATPEMIAEYNKLVKYYNSLPQKNFVVKQEDANRIMAILSRMTPKQEEKAEKIRFNIPPPPPSPSAPEAKTIEEQPAPKIINDKQIVLPPIPPVNEPVIITVVEDAPPPPPQPPSPPAPPTFEKLVADGAIFYYNGKIIEPEKARVLVEVRKSVNVQITYTDAGKPTVKLTDKKDND